MPRTSQLEFPICSFPTAAATPLKWVCLEVFITCLSPGEKQQPGLQLMQLVILLYLSQVPHPAIFSPTKSLLQTFAPPKAPCLLAQHHALHRGKDFKALIFLFMSWGDFGCHIEQPHSAQEGFYQLSTLSKLTFSV